MSRFNEYLENAKRDTRFISDKELEKHIQIAVDNCKDPYAQSYLHKIMEAWDQYGNRGLAVQLLYALNNMQTWKGDQARETKAYFKSVIKTINRERDE